MAPTLKGLGGMGVPVDPPRCVATDGKEMLNGKVGVESLGRWAMAGCGVGGRRILCGVAPRVGVGHFGPCS